MDDGALRTLRDKAYQVMQPVLVVKDPAAEGPLSRLPRYVQDHLTAVYGPVEAERLVARHYPTPERHQAWRHALLKGETVTVLDHLRVDVDLDRGIAYGRLAGFDLGPVGIPEALPDQHPQLLGAGLWGTVQLRFGPLRARDPAVVVAGFQPVSAEVDEHQFVAWRAAFTWTEWLDLWLLALGYHPLRLVERVHDPLRTKLLVLVRLVPLVEPHYNLIELGPKNTGKTFLYRNVSADAFVVSGGTTTPANLFVNLKTGAPGLVATTRCVVFDEVGGLRVQDELGTVAILKDYMESGHFSRGGRDYAADASVVLLGNIALEAGQPASYYAHLVQDLPPSLIDPAVLDRLHAFLPGWEVPKLTPAHLDVRWGWALDYVAAVLRALRWWPVEPAVSRLLADHPLAPGATHRDARAVTKTVRGLVKLLAPHGVVPPDLAGRILGLAAELRQRVHNQLTVIDPGEFPPRMLGFSGVEPSRAPDLERVRPWDETDRRLNTAPRPGEITALLVQSDADGRPVLGVVQVVEVSILKGARGLRLTGFRGPAMAASAETAYHYLKEHLPDFRVPRDALDNAAVVVHLVSIAVPREGASAGLAFLLGMVSAITGRPVRPGLAVTGEVSLHGDIGPVGGLVPKLEAAARHGRRVVLIPKANAAESDALPATLAARLVVRPVGTVAEALGDAFGLTALRGRRADRE
jgi:ATP-dependent Lon protease